MTDKVAGSDATGQPSWSEKAARQIDYILAKAVHDNLGSSVGCFAGVSVRDLMEIIESHAPRSETATPEPYFDFTYGCRVNRCARDGECLKAGQCLGLKTGAPPSATATPQWQPMETAPKDGRKILIVCATDEEPEIEVTEYFTVQHHRWEDAGNDLWRKVPTEPYSSWNGNGHRATHWMPLPEVPSV